MVENLRDFLIAMALYCSPVYLEIATTGFHEALVDCQMSNEIRHLSPVSIGQLNVGANSI